MEGSLIWDSLNGKGCALLSPFLSRQVKYPSPGPRPANGKKDCPEPLFCHRVLRRPVHPSLLQEAKVQSVAPHHRYKELGRWIALSASTSLFLFPLLSPFFPTNLPRCRQRIEIQSLRRAPSQDPGLSWPTPACGSLATNVFAHHWCLPVRHLTHALSLISACFMI